MTLPYCYYYLRVLYFANFCDSKNRKIKYCNRTNFRTRFNFVYFVLLAESTKFSGIRKPYTYACVSDTTFAVRKLTNARVRNFYAYENFCDYSARKNGVYIQVQSQTVFQFGTCIIVLY